MPQILDGKAVAAALSEKLRAQAGELKKHDVTPGLATVRVGERGDDIAYERGATKRCQSVGIDVKSFVLPQETTQAQLLDLIGRINADSSIHGCLIFMPLPKHIDENAVRAALAPEKDVDGITIGSQAGVYAGKPMGFPPCTPQACMEILSHYGIDLTGKNAVVFGRSLVVGKPAAMMLLGRNATVTVCHTKTREAHRIASQAEVLIVAAGRPGVVNRDFLNPDQIVIDVGINVNAEGKLCGDVNWDDAQTVKAVSPVPGGVGSVTTTVLAKHVVEAAQRTLQLEGN